MQPSEAIIRIAEIDDAEYITFYELETDNEISKDENKTIEI
jgi:hypothetical protein